MKKKYNGWLLFAGIFLFLFALIKSILSFTIFPPIYIHLTTMLIGLCFIYLSHKIQNI